MAGILSFYSFKGIPMSPSRFVTWMHVFSMSALFAFTVCPTRSSLPASQKVEQLSLQFDGFPIRPNENSYMYYNFPLLPIKYGQVYR